MASFRNALTINKEGNTNLTTTVNGALALRSTGVALLDFYTNVLARVKGIRTSDADIASKLENCWEESPQDTLRMIAYKRDCRGGAGERHVGEVCWRWLAEHHPEQAKVNLENMVFYGRWNDLLGLCGTSLEDEALTHMAVQILVDLQVYHKAMELSKVSDSDSSTVRKLIGSISLASKWAPTEGDALDRSVRKAARESKTKVVVPSVRLARMLYPEWNASVNHGAVMKYYRTEIISPLRTATGVVEQLLCSK